MTDGSLRPAAAALTMGLAILIVTIEPACAQSSGIQSILQNIVNLIQGEVMRLLAILAVIIVGLAWMFGYLDLRKAAYAVLGIAIVFGASDIVSTLTGK